MTTKRRCGTPLLGRWAALAILVAFAAMCGVSIAATPATTPARAGARGAAAAETLTATVQAIDPRAGTLDLLTGVGHALRIRRVRLPPRLEITRGRTASPVATLMPGSIVRIEYRRTTSGMVATVVELVRPPVTERRP